MFRRATLVLVAAGLLGSDGCGPPKRELANLSGKITLNGKPVPTGFINFSPDVQGGNTGESRGFEIKDGVYDTAAGPNPGIYPGANKIYIQGFDGKVPEGRNADFWPKGKQVMNPYTFDLKIETGSNTKDIDVPPSYGQNVKIQPVGDPKAPGEK